MDPNQIIGQPQDREVWLAPDWSNYGPAQKDKTWTKVKVREIRYADGRIVTVVLDKGGQPLAADGTTTTPAQARVLDQQVDDEQARRFRQGRQDTAPDAVAAPPNQPSIVTRDPNTGAISTTPNPNYTPPASSTTAAQPPETKDEGGRRWVWQPNPGGPNAGGTWVDAGPAPETPAERQAREAAQTAQIGKPTGNTRTRSNNGTTVKETEYLLPDGTTTWRSQSEVGEPDRVGKPTGNTRTRTENGQAIKETEYVLPNGTKEWRTQTEAKPQIPSSVPPFVPDWSKQGLGLVEYANAIRARTDLTDDQKKDVITAAHLNATSTVSQANSLIDVQQTEASRQTTERGQDVGMANQRLSTSSANFGNALRAAQAATKYSVGPDAAAVLPYYLAQAAGQAAAYGGFTTPPRVQPGPAVQQVGQMGVPGLATLIGNGPWGSGGTTVNPINPNGPGQPGVAPAPAPLLGPPPAALATPPSAPVVPAPAMTAPAPVAPRPAAAQAPRLPEATPGGGPPAPVGAPGFSGGPVAPQLPEAVPGGGPPPPPPMPAQPAVPAAPAYDPLPGYAPFPDPGMGPDPGQTTAPAQPAEPMVTVRNRISGETMTIPRSRWERQNVLTRNVWEEMRVLTEDPAPDPGAAPPPAPVTMAPTGTPSMASMLGAGPWAQQAQPDPTGMAQMVAMQGQRALMGYDPSIVNQEALADGFDPEVVALFGGGIS